MSAETACFELIYFFRGPLPSLFFVLLSSTHPVAGRLEEKPWFWLFRLDGPRFSLGREDYDRPFFLPPFILLFS